MLRHASVRLLAGATVLLAGLPATLSAQLKVSSPDGRNQVTVEVQGGRLTWSLARDGKALVLPSGLGFAFRGAPQLRDSLRLPAGVCPSPDTDAQMAVIQPDGWVIDMYNGVVVSGNRVIARQSLPEWSFLRPAVSPGRSRSAKPRR